jgi:class 3 adenylate cyclase
VEYSVVGDVVNLAQRLQGMSDGDAVIIDEATFAALDGAIAASPMPARTVKGRTAMVEAYRIDIPSTVDVTPQTGI